MMLYVCYAGGIHQRSVASAGEFSKYVSELPVFWNGEEWPVAYSNSVWKENCDPHWPGYFSTSDAWNWGCGQLERYICLSNTGWTRR
jgi:hypothetical protein